MMYLKTNPISAVIPSTEENRATLVNNNNNKNGGGGVAPASREKVKILRDLFIYLLHVYFVVLFTTALILFCNFQILILM